MNDHGYEHKIITLAIETINALAQKQKKLNDELKDRIIEIEKKLNRLQL